MGKVFLWGVKLDHGLGKCRMGREKGGHFNRFPYMFMNALVLVVAYLYSQEALYPCCVFGELGRTQGEFTFGTNGESYGNWGRKAQKRLQLGADTQGGL